MSVINYSNVIHFHQPVGQVKPVLEGIHGRCYEMWLRIFRRFPKIKFTVHFSGSLLDWMLEERRDFIRGLKELVAVGRLEVLTGGYYEPILPMIPDEDKLTQIELLSARLREIFGERPKGLWLAERVWEPSLPKPLAEAGVEFVLLDDSHFRMAGYKEEPFHAYLTEEQGRSIVVFPLNERLRYIMLDEPPHKSVDYLVRAGTREGDRIIIFFTDAEKYGEWSDPAHAEKWLTEYFSLVERTPGIIPVHLGEYLMKFKPRGLVYLPSASYDRMMEWSGGYFRNFLVKYWESNNMYRKMLYVRGKLKDAEAAGVPRESLEGAWTRIYKCQCNDAYWHGLFGGVYIPGLREAIYQNLIQAEMLVERCIEQKFGPKGEVRVVENDFDRDGEPEILLEGRRLNVYVKPDDGGSIFELDLKGEAAHNFVNTLTRKSEGYHASWAEKPATDWYRRTLLRDHLLRRSLSLKGFLEMEPFFDQGDFTLGRFEHEVSRKGSDVEVKLFRLGSDFSKGYGRPLAVTKTITVPLDSAVLSVKYEVKNPGDESLDLLFAPEMAVSPPSVPPHGSVVFRITTKTSVFEMAPTSEVVERSVRGCSLVDKSSGTAIEVEWDEPTELWLAPLKARARTEKGPMDIYQCTSIMPIFKMDLPPDVGRTLGIEINVVGKG